MLKPSVVLLRDTRLCSWARLVLLFQDHRTPNITAAPQASWSAPVMGDLMYPHQPPSPYPMAHNSMLNAMPVYLQPQVSVLPHPHMMAHMDPVRLMELPPSVRPVPLPLRMMPVGGMMPQQQMEMGLMPAGASKSSETMNAQGGAEDTASGAGTWPVQGSLEATLGSSTSNARSVEQFETPHDAATAIATGASNGPNRAEGSLSSTQPASPPLMTTTAAPGLATASAGLQIPTTWPGGAAIGAYNHSSSIMMAPATYSGMTVNANSIPLAREVHPAYQRSAPPTVETLAFDASASGKSWPGLALSPPAGGGSSDVMSSTVTATPA